ncbi:MAG: type II secretion system protein GspM [Thauera sp.]|jgi:general secretion pathway protein M|nr:type II secretion system protein GspM [Thauera sp.]
MNALLRHRSLVAAGVTLLAVLLVLVPLVLYVAEKRAWAESRLEEIAPLHARMAGLAQMQDELAAAAEQAERALGQLAYAASVDPTQAGNDGQQRARAAIAEAGMAISSSQVLGANPDGNFDRIPITIQAEGSLDQLQAALMALAGASPAFGLEQIAIRATGAPGDAARGLSCRMTLSVLRRRG